MKIKETWEENKQNMFLSLLCTGVVFFRHLKDNYKQVAFNYLNDLLKLHSAVINIAMDSCDNRFKGKL